MRVAVVVLASIAGTIAMPESADACSCGHGPPTISPADGATDVPVNAVPIVRFYYATTPEVELRDASTMQPIATVLDVRVPPRSYFGTTAFVKPVESLAPNKTYQLIAREYAGAFERQTTFTTGDAMDTTAPAFTGIVTLSPETMSWPIVEADGSSCFSSCTELGAGRISRIHLDYPEPPADVVHVELELRRVGEDAIERIPLSSYTPRYLGFETCNTQSPVLEPGAEYCGRILAYDIAGNPSGEGAEVCALAASCAPLGNGTALNPNCEPSDECRPIEPAPPESSGCTSTRSIGLLLALAALFARRRTT